MALQGREQGALLQVPDLERVVVRGRDRAPPVRRHRHRSDLVAMALQGRQQRALLQVPDLERPVDRARDRAPPVRRHRHRSDPMSPVALPGCAAAAPLLQVPAPSASAVRREPETARRPSGVTATALTQSPWPSRVASSAPCSRSQTLSVLSSEPETARRPSGVTATALTAAPWPSRVASSAPCSRSQTLSVVVRARDRAPPVRRHRHRHDPIAMALQRRQQRALLQVPDLERLVVRPRDRAPPVRRHRHRPDPPHGPPESPAAVRRAASANAAEAPARAGPRRRARRREARGSPGHRRSRGGPGAGRRAGAADGSGHGRKDGGRGETRRLSLVAQRLEILDQPVDARDLELPAQPAVVEQQRTALVRSPGLGKVVQGRY